MRVCKDCFSDEELCREIDSNAETEGKCDICGGRGKVIDVNDLYDFLSNVVNLFCKNPEATETITDILQNDWNLFNNVRCADIIVTEILDRMNPGFGLNDKVSYTHNIMDRIDVWSQLKKTVREEYRFFFEHNKFDEYADLTPTYILKAGAILYRARITPMGQKRIRRANMGCPPSSKAVAGRANPVGIPYLYMCRDEKTTYYEVRAGYMDRLSIGTFMINRDLEIVDFNSKASLYLAYNGGASLVDTVVRKKILEAISIDLSKPLRRYDTELEYIPTQLICEYCKINGADGICFDSSLHKNGLNYVLFNPADATCIKVTSREIKNIDIDIC